MKRFRVRTEIDEHGNEKHYPQYSYLRVFWFDYHINTDAYSLEELAEIRKAISIIESSYTNYGLKFKPTDSIYFYTFNQASRFIRFVETDLWLILAKNQLMEEVKQSKRQTIIRPIDL